MEEFFVPVAALLLVLVLVFFGSVPQLVHAQPGCSVNFEQCAARRRGSCTKLSKSWTCMPIRFYEEETYGKRAAEATRVSRD
jgi:hypothetical protein